MKEDYLGATGLARVWSAIKSKFVPQNRKINNKALSGDITLSAEDVGAEAATKVFNTSLTAIGWVNNTQVITVAGSTENARIGLAMTATDEQIQAAMSARMLATGQTENTITVTAYGGAPAIDIPVTIHTNG